MTSPAGWYEDPGAPTGSGQLRWWDGAAWSSHTRGPSTSPGAAQPVQPQYGLQPQYGQTHGHQYAPAAQDEYGGNQYGGNQYGGKATQTPDGVPLAGVWSRLGAKLIDGILLGVVNLLVLLPVIPGVLDLLSEYSAELDSAAASGATVDPFALYTDPRYLQFALWSLVSGVLISALYTVILLRWKGATLGKLALGMRVRRWDRGGQLSWGQCLGRWAAEYLPQLACGLWFFVDSLWCTWDSRRQTLHDKMASTVVTKR